MPDVRKPTPLSRPKVGLLAQAIVNEASTLRFQDGLIWRPEQDANEVNGSTTMQNRELKCVTNALSTADKPDNEQAFPWTVTVYDKCSAFDDADVSADATDRQARALRLLEASRSWLIAREFWKGTIAQNFSLANTWLAKNDAVIMCAATTPILALGWLDELASIYRTDQQAFIHCNPRQLAQLVGAYLVRREGNRWLTPMDNIVVADGGYTGSMDGQSGLNWMVVTPPVTIDLRQPYVTPVDAIEHFDRSVNDIVVWAYQEVIVQWEPQLLHGAAAIA